jgi:hypothetical protein
MFAMRARLPASVSSASVPSVSCSHVRRRPAFVRIDGGGLRIHMPAVSGSRFGRLAGVRPVSDCVPAWRNAGIISERSTVR